MCLIALMHPLQRLTRFHEVSCGAKYCSKQVHTPCSKGGCILKKHHNLVFVRTTDNWPSVDQVCLHLSTHLPLLLSSSPFPRTDLFKESSFHLQLEAVGSPEMLTYIYLTACPLDCNFYRHCFTFVCPKVLTCESH